jgi:hypothetical protein
VLALPGYQVQVVLRLEYVVPFYVLGFHLTTSFSYLSLRLAPYLTILKLFTPLLKGLAWDGGRNDWGSLVCPAIPVFLPHVPILYIINIETLTFGIRFCGQPMFDLYLDTNTCRMEIHTP